MTSNSIQPDELLAWLSASCQRQDLPLLINDPATISLINDPATISKVAVLLGVRTPAPSRHSKRLPKTPNAPTIDPTTQSMAA